MKYAIIRELQDALTDASVIKEEAPENIKRSWNVLEEYLDELLDQNFR